MSNVMEMYIRLMYNIEIIKTYQLSNDYRCRPEAKVKCDDNQDIQNTNRPTVPLICLAGFMLYDRILNNTKNIQNNYQCMYAHLFVKTTKQFSL